MDSLIFICYKFETFLANEIVQTAEILENNGLTFQDFWHYTFALSLQGVYVKSSHRYYKAM